MPARPQLITPIGLERLERPVRVGIVGGGPAGAFCAIWLCRLAREQRLNLDVTIYDHKSFEALGPAGCNMCAGVIPDSLVRNLHSLGIDLPEHVIQRRLEGYVLHTRGGSVDIRTPEGKTIYATFRGPGPLGMYPAAHEGFDWWLLSEAQQAGAKHISKLVTDVHMPSSRDAPFSVSCRDGSTYESDLLVAAFGVNSNLVKVFEQLGWGYCAPRTVRARQAEITLDPEFIQNQLHNRALIFAMGWLGLRFVAITPKRQHVTVTLIGDNPDRGLLKEVLRSSEIKEHFPNGWEPPARYCSCAPRMPVSAARNPVYDRLLMIGDTNISRYLKNGIESSYYTAMWAAKAICSGMTTKAELTRYYAANCYRSYGRDNRFGRFLFRLHDLISRSKIMARAHLLVAQREQETQLAIKPMSEILWGMFTGSAPYRKILWKALNPRLQFRLLKTMILASGSKAIRPSHTATRQFPTMQSTLGSVKTGKTVIIVGGGPAGTVCAITLASNGKLQGDGPEIVLIEGKVFGEHQNQDAGVLSPPGPQMLGEILGGVSPTKLLQRTIRGYVLHGREQEILLDGTELGEHSFALRRVELDSTLLAHARASGVNVVHARATAMEVDDDGVVIYTEGDSYRGDVVVGAFALDEGMAGAVSRRTRYQPPASLETLACKIHPAGLEFIPGLLDDCIHVFLPRQRGVEFGALTPKGNHIVVIIAGAHLAARDMERFLAQESVARLIPVGSSLSSFYKGAFPLGPAKGLCGDRYVMIGDAAGLVRPFKGKGINCALESGKRCAEVMLEHGISQQALSLVERSQRKFTRDVWYGRLVRFLVLLTKRFALLDACIVEARRNPALRSALFDCVSGRTTYREVVLRREHLQWLPKVLWRWLRG